MKLQYIRSRPQGDGDKLPSVDLFFTMGSRFVTKCCAYDPSVCQAEPLSLSAQVGMAGIEATRELYQLEHGENWREKCAGHRSGVSVSEVIEQAKALAPEMFRS